MAFPIIAAIAGVVSAGAAIASSVSAGNAQNDASAREDARLQQQYEQDVKTYDFNWEQTLREYNQAKDAISIQRTQEETLGQLQDAVALQQYNYNLAIRDYEYLNNLKQYQASEKRYNNQLNFNNLAADLAYQSEIQRQREIEIGASFDAQDMIVEMLQEQGMMQARGVSGKSAKKGINSVLAAYGRNQAVLAESLVSARRQSGRNMMDINLNKYGADLQAEANRMLMPTRGPAPPVPFRTPRATFLDPLEPQKGPAPVKGVNTTPRASSLGIAAGVLGGIAGGVQTGLGTYSTLKSFK